MRDGTVFKNFRKAEQLRGRGASGDVHRIAPVVGECRQSRCG
ncbi:hypothetical protein N9F34_03455 [Alphaproteobacteria bacterium]|nr:hypothetical protein [Alphaproteobacteria bacterium]